eukprot:8946282-Lingulodinium_polyedra.AAC.1
MAQVPHLLDKPLAAMADNGQFVVVVATVPAKPPAKRLRQMSGKKVVQMGDRVGADARRGGARQGLRGRAR